MFEACIFGYTLLKLAYGPIAHDMEKFRRTSNGYNSVANSYKNKFGTIFFFFSCFAKLYIPESLDMFQQRFGLRYLIKTL